VDISIGGTLTSAIGWIPLALFVAWLAWTRRLPIKDQPQESQEASPLPAVT